MRRSVLALCVLLITGCGGGSEGSASPAEPTVKAWGTNVNRVCQENREATRRIVQEVATDGRKRSKNELTAEALDRTRPTIAGFLTKLRGVRTPSEIQPAFDRFLSDIEASQPLFGQLVDDLRKGRNDPELTTKFTQIAGRTRPFATKYGLLECLPDQG